MVLALSNVNHVYSINCSVVIEHFTDHRHYPSLILSINWALKIYHWVLCLMMKNRSRSEFVKCVNSRMIWWFSIQFPRWYVARRNIDWWTTNIELVRNFRYVTRCTWVSIQLSLKSHLPRWFSYGVNIQLILLEAFWPLTRWCFHLLLGQSLYCIHIDRILRYFMLFSHHTRRVFVTLYLHLLARTFTLSHSINFIDLESAYEIHGTAFNMLSWDFLMNVEV